MENGIQKAIDDVTEIGGMVGCVEFPEGTTDPIWFAGQGVLATVTFSDGNQYSLLSMGSVRLVDFKTGELAFDGKLRDGASAEVRAIFENGIGEGRDAKLESLHALVDFSESNWFSGRNEADEQADRVFDHPEDFFKWVLEDRTVNSR